MFYFSLVSSSMMDLFYPYIYTFVVLIFLYHFAVLHVVPLVLKSSITTPTVKDRNFTSCIQHEFFFYSN